MKILRIYFFITVILISMSASSQKLWTLEDCINYAYANNIQIKQQSLNVEAAKDNLLQSKAGLLPDINGSASSYYNYGRTVDRFTNEFATDRVRSDNFYLSSSITLFNGFQLLNNIKKSKLDLMSSEYEVEKMKNDISLNVATAYLQVLYSKELLEIAKQQLDITEQQVERTKKLVDAGSVANGSLLDIEAQMATEEMNVVQAQNSVDMNYLTLTQMLELPGKEGFDIEKPLIEVIDSALSSVDVEKVYNSALAARPEIKSAEIKLESSVKSVAIAKGGRSPVISLGGSFGTGYSDARREVKDIQFYEDTIGYTAEASPVYVLTSIPTYDYSLIPYNDQINDNLNKSIGIGISIPLFNNLRITTNISQSKLAAQNAEYNLQLAKNQLRKDIQQAYSDAQAALKKYNAAVKSVDALKESFRYAQQKFDLGMLTSVEYNEAKNKLAKAESDLLQAKYEYVFRIKILDFYQGNTLSFNK